MARQLFSVEGKAALVTGGSEGLGRMIAEGLLMGGAEVWICARNADNLESAEKALAAYGSVKSIVADLGSEDGIRTVGRALNSSGPLHILVNNAGTTWGAPMERYPRKAFQKVMDVNLLAPFDLTRELLPSLRSGAAPDNPSRVINIASFQSFSVPEWESYAYSASKAGLAHLTRHMGRFLATENISVNAIAPGYFPTRRAATIMDMNDETSLAKFASPLGGRLGRRDDIAGAVIYLSSQAGAWLSGAVLPVSGGRGCID